MTSIPKTPLGQEKPGHIKVGSEILVHLGRGIYSTPANALKELVTNSYDADATKVTIRAKPDMDNVVVLDDGNGMNEEDFEQHFAIVARSYARERGLYTSKFHRPIIGRYGIGFLAISQICDQIRIISSKENEPFRLEASMDFAAHKAAAKKVTEYEYEVGSYTFVNQVEDADKHYTIVILEGLAEGFRDDLLDKKLNAPGEELPHRYSRIREDFTGQPFEDIAERLLTGRTRDLRRQVGGYWVFLMELAAMVPIPYLDNGPINYSAFTRSKFAEQAKKVQYLKDSVADLKFTLDFDGIELKKPILLPSAHFADPSRAIQDDEYYIDTFEFDKIVGGERLAFKGYLYNQRYSISPGELHGIAVRIKNTSIGGLRQDFLEYPAPEKLFFQQSMGEVYVEDGLEDAMNIDRATFRIGHPHYSALQEFIHRELAKLFRESRGRYVRRRRAQEVTLQDVVLNQLHELFGVDFVLSSSSRAAEIPVALDTVVGTATVYRSHKVFSNLSAAERRVRASDLILFEAATKLGTDRNQVREIYHRLLGERAVSVGK